MLSTVDGSQDKHGINILQICNKYHKYFAFKMEGGISNKTIVRFFVEPAVDEIKKNFIGLFTSNVINRFLSFHDMISKSGVKYPFVVMDTDRYNKKGTHWWIFLHFQVKKINLLFDSFDFQDFKEFAIKDDQKIINKICYGVEKFDKKDNKITLVTLIFNIPEYKKLKNFDKLLIC